MVIIQLIVRNREATLLRSTRWHNKQEYSIALSVVNVTMMECELSHKIVNITSGAETWTSNINQLYSS